MADKIRWGILGCGAIASKFADALRHIEDAQLVAAGSRTQENADRFSHSHGIPRRYGSYQALAEDKDIDIIYIATPHHLHMENTMLCLNAGKHVLCEKPLAVNASQGQAMIDCAKANKRFLMEAMWTRFLPLMDKVRELLADNALGEVRMLAADFGFRCSTDTGKQRLINPHLAGGALLDVGIYPLALSSMLFGSPRQVQSSAFLGETGVDEQNAVILTFAQGQLAILYSAIQTETPHQAAIMGTKAMIRLPYSWWKGNQLIVTPRGQSEQSMVLPTFDNGFIYEILAVQNDLRAGRLDNNLMPLNESLNILRTMDAIRQQWDFKYPFEIN